MKFSRVNFRFSYSYFWKSVILVFVFLMISLPLIPARAAVTLLYFQAQGGNNQVTLRWATATELDNIGFFVQRSSQRDSGYTRVNANIIPAQGDGFTGANYNYVDTGLTNGTSYWYRLESIDSGQQSTYSDPVMATVGSTPTPTQPRIQTGTATQTLTPTSTTSGSTVVPTKTRTATTIPQSFPQPTPTLAQPTIRPPTQNQPPYPGPTQTPPPAAPTTAGSQLTTGTLQAEQSNLYGDATATFVPFPTVTIDFPQVNQGNEAPLPITSADSGGLPELKSIINLWPLGLVVIIWIGLGIWFYFTQRHFH